MYDKLNKVLTNNDLLANNFHCFDIAAAVFYIFFVALFLFIVFHLILSICCSAMLYVVPVTNDGNENTEEIDEGKTINILL